MLPDFQDYFDDIVDVALGIDAAWDCEADQIHFCGTGEHERADFYGADSAFQIEFRRERYAGKLIGGNVRKEGAGVKVDGVSAGGWTMGTPWLAM